MVHDPPVARLVLDRRDVPVLAQVGGDHEATVDVLARRGDLEVGGQLDDEVGGAERPVVGEGRGSRDEGGVALGAPPSAQAVSVAMSAAESERLCLNRGVSWGAAFQGGIRRSLVTVGDVARAFAGLGEGLERERTDLAPAMALEAVLLEDGRNRAAVGRHRRRLARLGDRAADRRHLRRHHGAPFQDGGDGVVQLAGRRVGVPLLPRGELVVDPSVVADPALVVDDERLGRDGGAKLRRQGHVLVVHDRVLQAEVLRVRSHLGRRQVGVGADADQPERLRGELLDDPVERRAVRVRDRAFGRNRR